VEAAEWCACPPVPISEQTHQCGDEHGAHDGGVEEDRCGGAEPKLFRDDDFRGEEGAEGDGEEQGSGGDDPSRSSAQLAKP
jgi:hypothetical protein